MSKVMYDLLMAISLVEKNFKIYMIIPSMLVCICLQMRILKR